MTEQQLTDAQRRKNAQRVRDIEAQLGQVEEMFAGVVYSAAAAMRRLHGMREELRDVFGMERLAPLAPLYEATAERHEEGERDG